MAVVCQQDTKAPSPALPSPLRSHLFGQLFNVEALGQRGLEARDVRVVQQRLWGKGVCMLGGGHAPGKKEGETGSWAPSILSLPSDTCAQFQLETRGVP